jgi:DnaJ-class molecular chaperone
VRIPKGADHGSKLRVPGRGATGPAGTGDLILETRIRPHPYFRREGLDLHLRLPVTVEEAYVGTTIEVPDATGTVNLRIPPRSQQGARLRLKERGVSRGAQRGHLYVELDVRLPEGDDADQQTALLEALKTVSAAYTKPVRQDVHL